MLEYKCIWSVITWEKFHKCLDRDSAGNFRSVFWSSLSIFKLYHSSPQYIVFKWRHGGRLLMFQNNETAAMLVNQANPVGVEIFSYVNAFFSSNKCT